MVSLLLPMGCAVELYLYLFGCLWRRPCRLSLLLLLLPDAPTKGKALLLFRLLLQPLWAHTGRGQCRAAVLVMVVLHHAGTFFSSAASLAFSASSAWRLASISSGVGPTGLGLGGASGRLKSLSWSSCAASASSSSACHDTVNSHEYKRSKPPTPTHTHTHTH